MTLKLLYNSKCPSVGNLSLGGNVYLSASNQENFCAVSPDQLASTLCADGTPVCLLFLVSEDIKLQ